MSNKKPVDNIDETCNESLNLIIGLTKIFNKLGTRLSKYLHDNGFIERVQANKHDSADWILWAILANVEALALCVQLGDMETLKTLQEVSQKFIKKQCFPSKNKNINLQ